MAEKVPGGDGIFTPLESEIGPRYSGQDLLAVELGKDLGKWIIKTYQSLIHTLLPCDTGNKLRRARHFESRIFAKR